VTTVHNHRFSWADPRFTYADVLTGSRLVMLPYLLYGIAKRDAWLSAVTMAVMIITDLVDGRIARKLGQAREFGKSLDSTVDFAVIYSLFVALTAAGELAVWQLLCVLLPGVLIAATELQAMRQARGFVLGPARFGKLTGLLQYAFLLVLLLGRLWAEPEWLSAARAALFGVLLAAVALNTVDYALRLTRMPRREQSA
jgi:CDP-diacylglycerol--glycerol-3-phosphate 3-phosphatidyltransferase